jgi:hypothetical protein
MTLNQQLIRYTTKPEHAAKNEELIRAVYAQLRQDRPEGLRYTAFRLIPIGSYRVFDA